MLISHKLTLSSVYTLNGMQHIMHISIHNVRFPAHEFHAVNNHLMTVGAIMVSYMPMRIYI